MSRKKISIVFGTRPEAIKMAMLVKELKAEESIDVDVCFSGQHKEMVLPIINFFEIKIDHSLDIMTPDQTLATLSARAIQAFDDYFIEVSPDLVLVQGDTTTAMCAAMAAFYRKIKIGHVEAGLRTYNMFSPFPEEFNRQVISRIANLHFAPTARAAKQLVAEKIDKETIHITGNTVIDALFFTINKIKEHAGVFEENYPWLDEKPFVLITGHRRENFGKGFEDICLAIKELSQKFPSYNFVYPVHLNPQVQKPVFELLSGLQNVHLISPLDYVQFTYFLSKCFLVLTDSGGVQEEAPSFGKPVLVMRDTTERQEAVESGVARLVGTNKELIVGEVSRLIEHKDEYDKMSKQQNPYGTGDASKKILSVIF